MNKIARINLIEKIKKIYNNYIYFVIIQEYWEIMVDD